jgi:hypothetical protein
MLLWTQSIATTTTNHQDYNNNNNNNNDNEHKLNNYDNRNRTSNSHGKRAYYANVAVFNGFAKGSCLGIMPLYFQMEQGSNNSDTIF